MEADYYQSKLDEMPSSTTHAEQQDQLGEAKPYAEQRDLTSSRAISSAFDAVRSTGSIPQIDSRSATLVLSHVTSIRSKIFHSLIPGSKLYRSWTFLRKTYREEERHDDTSVTRFSHRDPKEMLQKGHRYKGGPTAEK
ncbi:hypothetical protein U1Q18_030724 [Sarracenia purpurea var. burkii]